MGQVTIYLEDRIETEMKAAAKTSKLSVSKWVAEIIKEKIETEWPAEIYDMAGTWNDFPSIKVLRSSSEKDIPRETL